jgi:hypothetical protein
VNEVLYPFLMTPIDNNCELWQRKEFVRMIAEKFHAKHRYMACLAESYFSCGVHAELQYVREQSSPLQSQAVVDTQSKINVQPMLHQRHPSNSIWTRRLATMDAGR